jgi:hypothetical protein
VSVRVTPVQQGGDSLYPELQKDELLLHAKEQLTAIIIVTVLLLLLLLFTFTDTTDPYFWRGQIHDSRPTRLDPMVKASLPSGPQG